MRPIKVIFVGDYNVGKTCVLVTKNSRKFPEHYVPIGLDNHPILVKKGNKEFPLTVWDIGNSEYENLRVLNYPNTDIFVLCYSTINKESFENVLSKWYPEVSNSCPEIPIILLGTKMDLRNDIIKFDSNHVTTAEGKKMKSKIGAKVFIECSARNMENVDLIFEKCVVEAINAKLCCLKKNCRIT